MKQGVEREVAQFERGHTLVFDEVELIWRKRNVAGASPDGFALETGLKRIIGDFRFVVQEAVVELVFLAGDVDASRKRGQFAIDHFLDDCTNDCADGVFEKATDLVTNRFVAIFDRRQISTALNIDFELTEIRFAIGRLHGRFCVETTAELIRRVHVGVCDRRLVRAVHRRKLTKRGFVLPGAGCDDSTTVEARTNSIRRFEIVVDVGEFRFTDTRRFHCQYTRTDRNDEFGQGDRLNRFGDLIGHVRMNDVQGFVGDAN